MRFELFIATRYLRRQTPPGLHAGVITGIFHPRSRRRSSLPHRTLAINNGFRQDLQSRLQAQPPTSAFSEYKATYQAIGVHSSTNCPSAARSSRRSPPSTTSPISRRPRARGAVLKGMLPQYERKVSDLSNRHAWDQPPR